MPHYVVEQISEPVNLSRNAYSGTLYLKLSSYKLFLQK